MRCRGAHNAEKYKNASQTFQRRWKPGIMKRIYQVALAIYMNDAKKRDFSSDRRAYNTKHSTSRKEQRATMDFFSFLWICTGDVLDEKHRRDEESAKEQLQWWIFNVFLLQNPFRFSTLCVTLLCFEAHTSIRWSSVFALRPSCSVHLPPIYWKKQYKSLLTERLWFKPRPRHYKDLDTINESKKTKSRVYYFKIYLFLYYIWLICFARWLNCKFLSNNRQESHRWPYSLRKIYIFY